MGCLLGDQLPKWPISEVTTSQTERFKSDLFTNNNNLVLKNIFDFCTKVVTCKHIFQILNWSSPFPLVSELFEVVEVCEIVEVVPGVLVELFGLSVELSIISWVRIIFSDDIWSSEFRRNSPETENNSGWLFVSFSMSFRGSI